MLELLFSLTGIGFGLLLAYVTGEEVRQGETYLRLLSEVIFLALALLIAYNLSSIYGSILSLIIAFFLHFAKRRWPSWRWEIAVYLSFIIGYWLLPAHSITVAVGIFLYGLPKGSLLLYGSKNIQKI